MGKNDRPFIFKGPMAHCCDERGDRTCRIECSDATLRRSRRRIANKARRRADRTACQEGR